MRAAGENHLSTKALKRAENSDLPLLALSAVAALRGSLDELELTHIDSARDKGASWEDIASAMGITRQALQQRLKTRTRLNGRPSEIRLPD